MSDRIKFRCDCGKKLNAPTISAGKRCKCTGCGRMMRIPLPAQPRGAPPQIGIRTSDPIAPAAVPNAFDFELELADLDELPPAASPSKPSAPLASHPTAATSQDVPRGIPISSPAGKSIWEEEAESAASTPFDATCPKCGAAMQSRAKFCAACGASRETGPRTGSTTLAPISKSRKRKSPGLGFGVSQVFEAFLSRWVLVPLVAGITFFVIGIREQQLANLSSAEPETISLSTLLTRGPNGNPNLILTDFQLCDNYVSETQTKFGVAVGGWKTFWVPIVSRGSDPNTAGVRALIVSHRVSNENDIVPTLVVQQLKGMVINEIASLSSKEKDKLKEGYPGVNFDNVIIFEENRQPASSEKIGYLLAGGGLLAVLGMGIGVKRLVSA